MTVKKKIYIKVESYICLGKQIISLNKTNKQHGLKPGVKNRDFQNLMLRKQNPDLRNHKPDMRNHKPDLRNQKPGYRS